MKNNSLHTILISLGVTDGPREIYLSLLTNGAANARTLAARTSIVRTSVYDHMKQLLTMNLAYEKSDDGVAVFVAASPEHLAVLMKENVERAEENYKALLNELPTLIAQTDTQKPRVRFFEGGHDMQQMLKDLLWHDDICISLYWPYSDMLDVLGTDFLTWFNARRIRNGITMRTIWPLNKKRTQHIFENADTGVSRKYLENKKSPSMSFLIYEDNVVFISSRKEAFGFIVTSKEFADMQHMLFDQLWRTAKK